MKRLALWIATLIGIASCGGKHGTSSGAGAGFASGGSGGAAACALVCGAVEETGALANKAEVEISGIVASLAHDGVYYVHNDSGDVARFFAIDAAGAALATFQVSGAGAVDWEDIARGPCPAGTCVFVGDIGDNDAKRGAYAVYRVAEPTTIADATLPAETLSFTYPDGSHNAETLLVDPVTGGLFVVTKTLGTAAVYAFPLPLTPGTSVVLARAGDVTLPIMPALITGGDVHPSGQGVLLRTYSNVWWFPQGPGCRCRRRCSGCRARCPRPTSRRARRSAGWRRARGTSPPAREGRGDSPGELLRAVNEARE